MLETLAVHPYYETADRSRFSSENVFKPGNLIHGTPQTSAEDLRSFFSNGILSGIKAQSPFPIPDAVCLSLITKQQTRRSLYEDINHFGPKQRDPYRNDSIAFIVSNDVYRLYGDKAFAVGYKFQKRLGIHTLWPKNLNAIHHFPIQKGDYAVLSHEVRVINTDGQVRILPQYFVGIVAFPHLVSRIQRASEDAGYFEPLPIFSPECENIGFVGVQ